MDPVILVKEVVQRCEAEVPAVLNLFQLPDTECNRQLVNSVLLRGAAIGMDVLKEALPKLG